MHLAWCAILTTKLYNAAGVVDFATVLYLRVNVGELVLPVGAFQSKTSMSTALRHRLRHILHENRII